MNKGTCPKVVLIVVDIIIFALGITTIIVNAVEGYSNYYYYPSAILLLIMILGLVGACTQNRGLLVASAVMCWVFAGVELTNIIVVWVGYAACVADVGSTQCYIYLIVGMTIIFCIGMLLLILSGVCAFMLNKVIQIRRNAGPNDLLTAENAQPLT
jgi:hypothetical protein